MVKEAISYFNKQVTYECKQTYLSKQVEYKTINATLFEPISANELSAKLRLPSEQIFFRLTTGFPHFVFFFNKKREICTKVAGEQQLKGS